MKSEQIMLANWGRRFVAWFVDYMIINVLLAYLNLEQLETAIVPSILLPHLLGVDISVWSPLSILVFFIYWTLCEWYFGRSIGQLLLNIRLVNLKGEGVTLRSSAIQSVGKSLLLPFDMIVGLVYEPSRSNRQRIFNRLSGTLVIFVGKSTRIVQTRHSEYAREP